jgi:hypothetical protein
MRATASGLVTTKKQTLATVTCSAVYTWQVEDPDLSGVVWGLTGFAGSNSDFNGFVLQS